MSKKDDIEDSRLVYTKKCGWLDLGHMLPEAAMKLLETLRLEKGIEILQEECNRLDIFNKEENGRISNA